MWALSVSEQITEITASFRDQKIASKASLGMEVKDASGDQTRSDHTVLHVALSAKLLRVISALRCLYKSFFKALWSLNLANPVLTKLGKSIT